MTELGTPERRRTVSRTLESVASIEEARGDLDSAITHYKESLEIERALAAEFSTPESRDHLSAYLTQVACLEETHGDLLGALAHHNEALQIRRALVTELGTPEIRRTLIWTLESVAGIAEVRGDLDGALAHYEESLAIQRQLLESLSTSDSPDSFNNLVWDVQHCASIEISLSRPDAALIRLESFVEQATILESATDANTLDTAATFWERHTEALDALARSAEASESRSRALALRARIAEPGSD